MKKIFITGGSSLLSVNLVTILKKKFNFFLNLHKKNININGTSNTKINLLNFKQLKKKISKINPHIIIHTAAISNIELCEKNKKKAKLINYQITKNITRICCDKNIKLIFISTDHLFSGNKKFYNETSYCNPLNYYSKTKLLSETYIKKKIKDYLILRTNFFGIGPRYRISFSDWIINSLKKNKKLFMFKDVFFTPILINDFVSVLTLLIKKKINGVINISCGERLSKYDFALKLAKVFKYNLSLVEPVSIKNSKLVHRPLDMSLDNSKMENYTGKKTKSIEASLKYLKQLINSKYYKKIKKI